MRRCLCVQTRVLWALQIALGWWMTDLMRDHGSASHCGSKVPGWRSRRIVSGWGWAVAGRRLDTQFTLRSVVIDATVSYKRELKIITFWFKLIVYIFQPYALKLAVYRRQSAISSAVYFHTQHFHANRWAFNGQTLVELDQGQTVRSSSNISHMNDNYIVTLLPRPLNERISPVLTWLWTHSSSLFILLFFSVWE
jgi:hypothetical protein